MLDMYCKKLAEEPSKISQIRDDLTSTLETLKHTAVQQKIIVDDVLDLSKLDTTKVRIPSHVCQQ